MNATLHTLQLREPFHIAHGSSSSRQVLRVQEGDRIAEAPFVPYYGEVPEETLRIVSQAVLPATLPRAATLAFNLLRHDIVCHAQNVPLGAVAEKILSSGGKSPSACHSLPIPSDLDAFGDKVERLSKQFRVLKLKLGSGDLGLDIATVSIARLAAPDAQLILDINGGWDVLQAPAMIEKIMEYAPALVEQLALGFERGPCELERLGRDHEVGAIPAQVPYGGVHPQEQVLLGRLRRPAER